MTKREVGMKSGTRLMAAEIVTIALCTGLAWAFEPAGAGEQPGMEAPGEVPPHAVMRALNNPEMIEKIGLTAEQVQKLQDALRDMQKQEIKLRSEQELVSLDQAELMTKPEVDEKAVMQTVEQLGKVHTEMAKLQMKRLLLLKKSLTTEQKDKLRALMQERRQEWRAREGREGKDSHPGMKRGQEMRRNAMHEKNARKGPGTMEPNKPDQPGAERQNPRPEMLPPPPQE